MGVGMVEGGSETAQALGESREIQAILQVDLKYCQAMGSSDSSCDVVPEL